MKFPHFLFDGKDIYFLFFIVTIETKIREFQYQVLNNIGFKNEKMFLSSKLWTRLFVPLYMRSGIPRTFVLTGDTLSAHSALPRKNTRMNSTRPLFFFSVNKLAYEK